MSEPRLLLERYRKWGKVCFVAWLASYPLVIALCFLEEPYLSGTVLMMDVFLLGMCVALMLSVSRRSFLLLFVMGFFQSLATTLVYAWHYSKFGLIFQCDDTVKIYDFMSAWYFSLITWCTVGYGDFTPSPEIRMLAACEAVTSIMFMPVATAFFWMMIVEAMLPKDASRSRFWEIFGE